MEIDYFVPKESSSGKYYYVDKTTGKSQWGSDTYFYIKKRLPKGWIRLDYNGNPVYKYIGDKIRYVGGKIVSTRSLVYSPKYIKELEILQKSFEDLDEEDEEEREEAHRKHDLFKKVADLLKLTPESIRDESVQFLAKKANILPQTIIHFIEILY